MASMASMASSSKSPTPRFTSIQESEREEHDEVQTPKHHPTPLHQSVKNGKPTGKKRTEPDRAAAEDDGPVSCNKCRPNSREKMSVVPLDSKSYIASPNNILKSILLSLTRKSPKPSENASTTAREEQWKIAVAELSHKLIHATRKRDEALLEASRLKYSMAELEKKLNKLEIYCHNLKLGFENSPLRYPIAVNDKLIEQFFISVSESRNAVRVLSRSLTMQLKHMGGKVYERISALLQPYDLKISLSKNPRGLIFYLEALLNKTFFDNFESIGFQKNSPNMVLNPIDRCETNYASFSVLKGLSWEEVLNKGTRYFSEDFSKFCDRKMSEIVAMLGWNRAWPEPLLQAFFGAVKGVWLVHLLGFSVHPSLPIFRVEKEVTFDSVYMEDMGGDKARKLVPTMVRIMVAPGFYVCGNVVKCKVLCRYNSNSNCNSDNNEKGLLQSP